MSYLKKLLGDAYKDGMTEKEIEKALEEVGASIPDPSGDDLRGEVERLKTALSKSNSENADWKKKLRAKQTEEEQKAQEDAERWEALQRSHDELLKAKSVSDNTAQLLALGYSEELAADTAAAMFEGDTAKIFANQKTHLESQKKAMKAELLKQTPTPPAGGEGNTGKEEFKKLSLAEKQQFYRDNPEGYREIFESDATKG